MSKLGRHKSTDAELKRSIIWLQTFNEITKVVLGFSQGARHHYPPGHLRHKSDVDGGIKLNGYSGKGVVDIFVKIEPIEYREDIVKKIKEKFVK